MRILFGDNSQDKLDYASMEHPVLRTHDENQCVRRATEQRPAKYGVLSGHLSYNRKSVNSRKWIVIGQSTARDQATSKANWNGIPNIKDMPQTIVMVCMKTLVDSVLSILSPDARQRWKSMLRGRASLSANHQSNFRISWL
jgi:hypothetical protein